MTTNPDLFEKKVRDLTFVLIEQNNVLRRTITRLLKEGGATNIVEAQTGKEGTMLLKANRDIGVIICSDHLDDLDSRKLFIGLSQDKKFDSTTQILISTNDDVQSMQKAIASGVDGYFIKPFPLNQLREKIQQAYNMRLKRLALKDLHVTLEVQVQIKVEQNLTQGFCVELARNECQIITEADLGIGSRVQLSLPLLTKGTIGWYDSIPGSVGSSRRSQEGGYLMKVTFTGKPTKSQGVLTTLHHYAQEQLESTN